MHLFRARPTIKTTTLLAIAFLLGGASISCTTTSTVSLTNPPYDGREHPSGGDRPLVIAHRGACGYMPEHTLEGYKLAIEMGADFIEPDLCCSKDGVLIARHEPNLSGSTNIADHPEFASRKTTRTLDGIPTTDWFASDFTLAELKALRCRQTMADRDQSKNDKYQIVALDEIIDLAKSETKRLGRTIGVYVETKSSIYHAALGLQLEDRLVDALSRAGWRDKSSPVIIESFESGSLRYLRTKTNVRLIQLVDGDDLDEGGGMTLKILARPYSFAVLGDARTYQDMLTREGLAEIKTYADGVGPWKPYLISARYVDRNNDGKPDDLNGDGALDFRDRVNLPPTDIVRTAHALGLFVHTWTCRAEPHYLASDYHDDMAAECRALYDLGIDGLFSDNPDLAVKARDGVAPRQSRP